jgi:cyclopropane fatty-acyl-phospholipid synthase-like methyltransferase
MDGSPLFAHREASAVVRYYAEATQDYSAWSRNFNMHFGYFRAGLNPLRLEPMLEEMTHQVLARLRLAPGAAHALLDAGCGMGAAARTLALRDPELRIEGVTLVPWQAQHAGDRIAHAGLGERVRIELGDYTCTRYPDACFDGVYAIESVCHAGGDDKRDFVREAARVLKPGARLVVADGFVRGRGPMNPLLRFCYRTVARNWAVERFADLDAFVRCVERSGFRDVVVEDISLRIAPSVMHIPVVMLRFLAGQLRRNGLHLSRVRWGHLLACALAPFLGMARSRFRYCIVSATRA